MNKFYVQCHSAEHRRAIINLLETYGYKLYNGDDVNKLDKTYPYDEKRNCIGFDGVVLFGWSLDAFERQQLYKKLDLNNIPKFVPPLKIGEHFVSNITKDTFNVGCQTISWEKVDQLLKLRPQK